VVGLGQVLAKQLALAPAILYLFVNCTVSIVSVSFGNGDGNT